MKFYTACWFDIKHFSVEEGSVVQPETLQAILGMCGMPVFKSREIGIG